ncbi:MAG TPA: alpha/beta hydrolase [Acidimicrobiales bacterium]|nr:alpha/beta hydrolase [Acidimicrobiales bacterium]
MSDATDDAASTTIESLVLRDGRALEVFTAGPPDGIAVVYHHGTPFAAVPYDSAAQSVSARGGCLVYWSRPGYAGSTSQPGRRVADAATDTGEVLDVLGYDRFVTLGWSGGGPHALACAAIMPGRCRSAAIIAGVAPFDAEGLDFLDGMGPENIEEFGLAAAGGAPFSEFLTRESAQFTTLSGPDMVEALGGLVSEVDKAALTGPLADFMARALAAAGSGSTAGWHDDDMAFLGDWGFDVTDVGCPVSIWQGRQDRMVPYAHGEWLATHVPGARPHLRPDDGHVSLFVGAFEHILDDLLTSAY